MDAKHEIYHLITQQARSFKFKLTNRCNCRRKPDCIQGNVIYQAKVTTETTTETYVGLALNFKEHYKNHQTSF